MRQREGEVGKEGGTGRGKEGVYSKVCSIHKSSVYNKYMRNS